MADRQQSTLTKLVWALTTMLTAVFISIYAPRLAPLVVGALVFLICLRDRAGLGGQYAELLKMGFGVVECNAALADHHARGGAGSLAFVLVAYAGFVALAWYFLRRFDSRARGAGQ